jgi:transcription-repair coupling factor (superfamily II helicase)
VLDRFGPVPEPVSNFIRTMRVRIRAAKWDLASVAVGKEGIVLKYRDRKKAEKLRARDPGAIRIMDEETILVVDRDVAEILA